MKKNAQLWLVILAFFIVAACLWYLESTSVIGAMSGVFLGVVGAYTTLDLRAVVHATSKQAPGSYEKAHRWKYLVGIILLCILFAECMVKQNLTGLNYELAYGMLGPGVLAVIAVVVGGMKINKKTTLDGPEGSGGG